MTAPTTDSEPGTADSAVTLDEAIETAYHSAVHACAMVDRDGDPLHWPYCEDFDEPGDNLATDLRKMADFVRANPLAPPEALWRYARSQRIHGEDVDGFHDAARRLTLPFRIFVTVLLAADAALAEFARCEAIEAAKGLPPIPATPIDIHDSILEPGGSILDGRFGGR